MRKLLVFLFATCLFADVSYIINMINQIQKYHFTYKEIPDYNIFAKNVIKDVNSTQKKETTVNVTDETLTLGAIFNNKAYILGRWLKKGDQIKGYKIIKITNNYVLLKKDGVIRKLTYKVKTLKADK